MTEEERQMYWQCWQQCLAALNVGVPAPPSLTDFVAMVDVIYSKVEPSRVDLHRS